MIAVTELQKENLLPFTFFILPFLFTLEKTKKKARTSHG